MKHPISKITAIVIIPIFFFGATLGLTYAPCYATVCPEDFLLDETRIHLGTFYLMLAITGLGLGLRATFPSVQLLLSHSTPFRVPVLGKRITTGGFVASIWIVGSTLATTGIWLTALLDFWALRADPLDWTIAKILLTVTGVTGHYADFLMALLVIPVSRNSLIGKAFGLHHSTLLFAHKAISYLFVAAVAAHGASYIVYATALGGEDEAREQAFATGNPTMTLEESEKRSSWFTTTTYNGIGTFLLIIVIVLTSIPILRRRAYNTFYYFHLFCSMSIFIGASVHASTDFYLLFPGLVLYIIDLGMRAFSGDTSGSHKKVKAMIENAGADWYRITLAQWEKSLANDGDAIEPTNEKAVVMGDPLRHYYINIPTVSKLQNHAFTAAIPSSSKSGPVFLFQRSGGRKQKRLDKEWTWKFGALVPNTRDTVELDLRLEGPYASSDTQYKTASHILCIVGGTGMTGAYSLAIWWLETRASDEDSTFTFVWSVRDQDTVSLQEWQKLKDIAASTPRLELVAHVSSDNGRLDPVLHMNRALGIDGASADTNPVVEKGVAPKGSVWVYSSGPDGLINATEDACVKARRTIRSGNQTPIGDISWYMAKWEV